MKYIEITEFTPPADREYDATAYPGRGVFLNPNTRNLVCISAMPFSTTFTACMVGSGPQDALIKEFEPVVAAPTTSYSEDFILKALAIAQQPQLAVNLLKGTT